MFDLECDIFDKGGTERLTESVRHKVCQVWNIFKIAHAYITKKCSFYIYAYSRINSTLYKISLSFSLVRWYSMSSIST